MPTAARIQPRPRMDLARYLIGQSEQLRGAELWGAGRRYARMEDWKEFGVDAGAPALEGNWAAMPDSYPAMAMDPWGFVHLHGQVRNATDDPNAGPIVTIPAAYRPAYEEHIFVAMWDVSFGIPSWCQLKVTAAGVVSVLTTGAAVDDEISLTGMRWRIARFG